MPSHLADLGVTPIDPPLVDEYSPTVSASVTGFLDREEDINTSKGNGIPVDVLTAQDTRLTSELPYANRAYSRTFY